jgi:hypothetical protein
MVLNCYFILVENPGKDTEKTRYQGLSPVRLLQAICQYVDKGEYVLFHVYGLEQAVEVRSELG